MKKIFILFIGFLVLVGCSSVDKGAKTIVFHPLNEQESTELSVEYGELLNAIEDPIKEGFTFSHWATHDSSTDGSEKFDFKKPIEKHTTLFAHYTKNEVVSENQSSDTSSGYEAIFLKYEAIIIEKAPEVGMTELAEIANEGVLEMADYMINAKGVDGQYETYEDWAGKLMDVYMNEAR